MTNGIDTYKGIADAARRKIRAMGYGAVVSPADFLDLGSRAAIDQALSRLAKCGMIKRLRRGVYYYPRVSETFGIELSPKADAIAQALARGQKSTLQVSGAQAANLLGLSEQVPARIVYLTDGATGTARIDNQTIELRHAAPRSMRTAGRISGTAIQALRYLGKDHVTPAVVTRLRTVLSDDDKRIVERDLLLAPGWMQPILASVVRGDLAKEREDG